MSTETNTASTTTAQDGQQGTSTEQEPQQTAEGTTPPEGTEQEQEGQQEDGKAIPEAKKYRLRAQQAEAERDTLQTRLNAMLNVEATRVIESAAQKLHNPADLFEIGGVKLEDVLAEDGMIDQGKIGAAIADLHKTRAYLFKETGGGNSALLRAAGDRDRMPSAPSWKNALKR